MAKGHIFNFWGGEKLTNMGATWFVSYAYYDRVDHEHKTWEKVKTWKLRKSTYQNTYEYHKFWLDQVADMNNDFLKKNTIGLNPIEIKRMANAVLEKLK